MNKPDQRSSIWTPANIVTLTRICLIPVFVIILLSPWPQWFGIHDLIDDNQKAIIAAGVFIVISCTDWIDGYLARSRNEVTDFGKFIDPLADKILVAAALIALVELQVIPSWPVLIILTREFIVSGIRMIAASKGIVIAASWYGKAKTVLQIIAIVLFIIKDSHYMTTFSSVVENPLYVVSWIVMLAALAMTIVSMLDYIAKSRQFLFSGDDTAKGKEAAADSAFAIYSPIYTESINELSNSVVTLAKEKGIRIGIAESLTGGMISSALTSVSGSSSAINGAVVTYVNSAKASLLNVNENLLAADGAVNEKTAEEMANGAADALNADLCVSVTGIAGPSGAEPGKPVGTVYMGTYSNGTVAVKRLDLDGDRQQIRTKTVIAALKSLENRLKAFK